MDNDLVEKICATRRKLATDGPIHVRSAGDFERVSIVRSDGDVRGAKNAAAWQSPSTNEIVITASSGVLGVEVKASATVNRDDFKGLRKLTAACGNAFKLGVVRYDSETTMPFGARLLPLRYPLVVVVRSFAFELRKSRWK